MRPLSSVAHSLGLRDAEGIEISRTCYRFYDRNMRELSNRKEGGEGRSTAALEASLLPARVRFLILLELWLVMRILN